MVYSSTVTSKGTITLPADVRKALSITPGQRVDIELIEASNKITIKVPISIDELRKRNRVHLRNMGIEYKPGEPIDHDVIWGQMAVDRYMRSMNGDA